MSRDREGRKGRGGESKRRGRARERGESEKEERGERWEEIGVEGEWEVRDGERKEGRKWKKGSRGKGE